MAIWIDTNGVLHDDMDGAALSLNNWPSGLTIATTQEIATAQAAKPVPLKDQAQVMLDIVTGPRGQIIRCIVAGVPVPIEWTNYVFALRAIANGTDMKSTSLPAQPAFVANT